jgi:multidrug efflux pump subunit AcrA (membrane-fusion protein)
MKRCGKRTAIAVCLTMAVGCGPKDDLARPKAPRPVSVIVLAESDPGRFQRVTGTVASWKTDQIGFEVDGRVEFVIEPETNIAGQVYDQNDQLIPEGTLLAQLDSTRYTLGVASANAQVEMAQKQLEAAQIEHERVIPAEEEAATALRDLAQVEVERNTKLLADNAAPERALDLSKAKLREAEATLVQLSANKAAKAAEVASLDANIRELQEAQKQAERDVADCRLYSSFAGQVADVHVVPGSYARQGQAAVTVQMMDPIKVELEVSAEQSRRLSYKAEVDIVIATSDGQDIDGNAIVYLTDPVADPNTRTFTVTLLMDNTKVASPIPEELQGGPVVRTNDLWRLFKDKLGTKDFYLTEANSIHEDEQGAYIWKIKSQDDQGTGGGRVFDLEQVRVTAGEVRLPFLGLWTFRELAVNEGEDFDLENDRIAGPLTIPSELADGFDGGKVLFDRPRWLLRPGDLVSVSLSGESFASGFYVPMNVISEQSGRYFVHIVDPDGGGVARKVEVKVLDAVNTQRRIEAIGDIELTEGTQLIAKGTHFIVDGEAVLVAEEAR